MSTYRKIHGRSIQAVTTDPSESVAEGQVWYNTTSETFKSIVSFEAWSSASPLSTGRFNLTGVGTDTAGLVFGGDTSPPETRRAESEEYNGSGWSTTPNMNTTRDLNGGFGIQTAAATAGGRSPSAPSGTNNTEEYNGSSWTAVPGTLNTTRFACGGFGTQTAGAVCGGTPPLSTATEEYNGSAWTSVNNLNTAMSSLQSTTSGTQTAGIAIGGYPNINIIQLYDGTNWTTSPGSLNTDRFAGSYQGAQTAGFYAGGELFPPSAATAATETWDGTSMTTSPVTLAAIQKYHTGSKSSPSTSGFVCGGQTPAATNNTTTQEYNKSANVITAAAWSAGGNMNTARGGTNGTSGDKTAGATFGGQAPGGRSNATELYDGSSWTNGTNTPATRRTYLVTGTQTASLLCGGQPPTPTANGDAETYEFDGSSFTETTDINNARDNAAGAGTQTAGLAIGGRTRPGTTFVPNNNVEEYDGNSWTTANVLPAANASSTSATGPQTAAIFALASPAYAASYDGTNWTAISATQAMPSSYTGTAVAGTDSSNAYLGGGEEPGGTRHGFMQKYDGTSWASQPSMATARNSYGFNGASPALLVCGGQANPGYTNATEEFTGETTAINVKTLTQS